VLPDVSIGVDDVDTAHAAVRELGCESSITDRQRTALLENFDPA